MKTEVLELDRNNIDEKIIKKAASLINEGELVAFPTETVYGLGADGLNDKACQKIFKAKHRPADNPLILHISDLEMLEKLVDDIKETDKALFKLWPGPLTLIFKKSKLIPDSVTAGGDTVAIRYPSDKIANRLIATANTPIAAPSANISGRPSPTNAADVFFDMDSTIPMILNGGESNIGIESTVLDLSEDVPVILRPGFYTFEFLKEIIPDVRLDDSLVDASVRPKSPGQKYKHYAPKAKMKVFVGQGAKDYIYDLANSYKEKSYRVGILGFEDSKEIFKDFNFISFGDRNDLSTMSHVLFSALRQMDRMDVDIILAEGVKENHLGKSIMNRMKKSAAGDVNYIGDK